jgi:hypothetical protein
MKSKAPSADMTFQRPLTYLLSQSLSRRAWGLISTRYHSVLWTSAARFNVARMKDLYQSRA